MFPAPPSPRHPPLDHPRHPGRPDAARRMPGAQLVRVLAVAVILGTAGLATLPGPAVAQGIEGSVSGTLLDGDGAPIPDAVVEFRRDLAGDLAEYHRTTSAADGTYSVSGLDNGSWIVTARHDGHRTNETTFQLGAGEERTLDIELLSVLEAYIVATVQNGEDGSPIQGAIATLRNPQGGTERTATSDAEGKFRLRLFSNENQLQVTKSGYHTYQDWIWQRQGDHERTIHLYPAPAQTVTIVGKVVDDATGAPVKSWIDLSPDWNRQRDEPHPEPQPLPADGGGDSGSDGNASGMSRDAAYYPHYDNNHNNTITEDDGTFTMKASPGYVVLSANRRGYLVEEARTQLQDGQTWNVELRLVALPERTVTISGRVTDAASGNALQGASVNIQVPDAGDSQWTDTDADGRYSVQVRPGHTLVEVRHWGHEVHATKSSGAEGTSAPSPPPAHQGREYHPQVQTLDTEANGAHDLQHALQARPAPGGSLIGYVIDSESGEAIADARVSIESHDNRDWGQATTDANGSYRFALYGGYHTVSVHLEGYLPARVNVDVPEEGQARLDIEVTPGTYAHEGWWHPDGGGPDCCYGYDEIAITEEGSYDGDSSAPASEPAPSAGFASDSESTRSAGSASGGNLRGSGGGLPAYDPDQAGETFENRESPSMAAFLLVMAIGLLAIVAGLRRP